MPVKVLGLFIRKVNLTGNIHYIDASKLSNTYVKKSSTSILIATFRFNVDYVGASGVHNFVVWKDSSNYSVDGMEIHSVSGQSPFSLSGSIPFSGLSTGSHTIYASPGRDNTANVTITRNASGAISSTYISSFLYITEVEV